MNLLAHALAERRVNQLMACDQPLAGERIAHDGREEVLAIGNLKGRGTKEKVRRNFGMPNPEGYRKALRTMKIAEKFRRPVFTFIDLTAANPGIAAEERGQAEAIARNLLEMARLKVPTIATITGEGGSGGALGLAVADRVLMLENAVYSVIPPEACGSIVWRDARKGPQAAAALKITSADVLRLGCLDDVIAEPAGGAQNDPEGAATILNEKLTWHLKELQAMSGEERMARRLSKFRQIAQFYTTA